MARKRDRGGAEVNASSMADIAFLLLIFFLVTTTIASDKGLALLLPPKQDPNNPPPPVKFNQRNIFKVLINSQDRLLVEDEPLTDISAIKDMVKEFVSNNGRDPLSSESPEEAVVSLKTDRGTSYETFINVLDELQGAYWELRAEKVGLTAQQYRELDQDNPDEKELYDRGQEAYPMRISVAEPTSIGGQ